MSETIRDNTLVITSAAVPATIDIDVDLSKRNFLKVGGVAGIGLLTTACPFDGVTKDKAVRYAGIAIDYLKDILPIASQIGGSQVAEFINRAIPALEKVKAALEKSNFDEAGSLFKTVTSALGQAATTLLQLAESARRNQIIALLTLANITLRTVSLFVETGTPVSSTASIPEGVRAAATPKALLAAFEATRF